VPPPLGIALHRTLALAAVAALGLVLVLSIRGPITPRGRDAARGHRLFNTEPRWVRGIEVELDGRHVASTRSARGWDVDGRPAATQTAEALGDLLDTLLALRAVDVFRAPDLAAFGLVRPRGTITVVTGRGPRRLLVGGLNAAGSAFYARRDGDPRVLQVGTLVLSEVDRVFYTMEAAR